jgi:DNA polymerase (family X)
MDNATYGQLLKDAASLIEITGGDPWRARTYARIGRELSKRAEPIDAVIASGNARSLPGIGASMEKHLVEIQATGTFDLMDELRAAVPAHILDITRISGLGPKKVRALWQELGVGSLADLEAVLADGRIAELKGFGKKSQDNIRAELARLERTAGKRALPAAMRLAGPVLTFLRSLPEVDRAEIAGSVRRGKDLVSDLDFVVASDAPLAVTQAIVGYELVREVVASGPTKTSFILPGDLQADIRIVEPEKFGALLHHFTGSADHNVAMRGRAKARGLTISEYGVASIETGEVVACEREEDIFAAVGLPYIPPELREGAGELDAADDGALPHLIERSDILGDLHMHTTASDGRNTIREMAEAARSFGHQYICITDHSKSQTVANGLDADRLRLHMADIDAVNDDIEGITVLKGIEVDILRDGSLDLPGELLDELDFVVGSVHASFRLDRGTMTERLCRAISSGHIHCVGHPTARKLGARDPIDFDFDAVVASCLDHGVALEINAGSGRLDLHDLHARRAANAGVPLLINTDSHSAGGFAQLYFGLCMARRAWLTPAHVLNTRPWAEVRAALGRGTD